MKVVSNAAWLTGGTSYHQNGKTTSASPSRCLTTTHFTSNMGSSASTSSEVSPLREMIAVLDMLNRFLQKNTKFYIPLRTSSLI